MLVSDYLHVGSTHELLLMFMQSELGLLDVSPPGVQLLALGENFERLRALALQNLAGTVKVPVPGTGPDSRPAVGVCGREEGLLFTKVYQSFNAFCDNDTLFRRTVYPLIGEVVSGNPAFRAAFGTALAAHVRQYGSPVGRRVLKTLQAFELHVLMPGVRQVVDALESTVSAAA